MEPSNQGRARKWSTIFLVITIIYAGLLSLLILFQTPRFEKVFMDFNTQLPAVTIWMLSPWFKFFVPGVALLAIIKELLPDKKVTLFLNVLVLAFLITVSVLYVIAMYGPLVMLIKAVSGGA